MIHIIETSKGSIEYSVVGKGKPILFLHGGHSNCRDTLFHKGFDLNEFLLITPTRPGYGKTSIYKSGSPIDSAELIVELIKHLQLDSITVFGISAGGPTALALSAHFPNYVSKLILVSAVSKLWPERTSTVYKMAKIIFHPSLEQLIWKLIRTFSILAPRLLAKNFFKEFSTKKVSQLDYHDVKQLVGMFQDYESNQGFMLDVKQCIRPEIIQMITCPTLIIHSKNDHSVPMYHAKWVHQLITNSKLIELDNEWGHLIWLGSDWENNITPIRKFVSKT